MKVLLQRVSDASVRIDGKLTASIGRGLVALVGVAVGDTEEDIEYLVSKMVELRIFTDDFGKFNLSALDTEAELLLVSQFTLLSDTRKGRRPSFTDAAPPEEAEVLFNEFVERARQMGLKVETGRFAARMQVEIHNDGPVTIMLDNRQR